VSGRTLLSFMDSFIAALCKYGPLFCSVAAFLPYLCSSSTPVPRPLASDVFCKVRQNFCLFFLFFAPTFMHPLAVAVQHKIFLRSGGGNLVFSPSFCVRSLFETVSSGLVFDLPFSSIVSFLTSTPRRFLPTSAAPTGPCDPSRVVLRSRFHDFLPFRRLTFPSPIVCPTPLCLGFFFDCFLAAGHFSRVLWCSFQFFLGTTCRCPSVLPYAILSFWPPPSCLRAA